MKVVDLGKCHTCGRQVEAVVDWENFVTPAGSVSSVIAVEGHCGISGHASKITELHIDDLDELPEWTPETEYIHERED